MVAAQRSDGKVAIVTGGGKGIGLASTLRLAAEGATVSAWGREVVTDLERALAGSELADRISPMVVDMADEEQIEGAVAEVVDEHGRIDTLVNNAGISPKGPDGRRTPPDETSTAEWDLVLAVNLRGPFIASRAVISHMRSQGWWRIVNISSQAGRGAAVNGGLAYAASKAGLNGMTRTFAAQLARTGITVNAIAPGFVLTPMTDSGDEQALERRRQRNPMGRNGWPEEVAALVAYLVSDEAGFTTGDTFDFNGGAYMAP